MKPAVFLDRDGVLIEDVHLLQRASDVHVLQGVPDALKKLRQVGFLLIIVSNQPIVARGLLTEVETLRLHQEVIRALEPTNGVLIDASYFCFHHPDADVSTYRRNCECRKPNPGLLLTAAKDHHIDMAKSFMIGDRVSDIAAGRNAGVRTILVETGAHLAPPIRSPEPIEADLRPDYQCRGLIEAADWIVNRSI